MENIILTLLSIPKIGRKSVDYFITSMKEVPKNEKDIVLEPPKKRGRPRKIDKVEKATKKAIGKTVNHKNFIFYNRACSIFIPNLFTCKTW